MTFSEVIMKKDIQARTQAIIVVAVSALWHCLWLLPKSHVLHFAGPRWEALGAVWGALLFGIPVPLCVLGFMFSCREWESRQKHPFLFYGASLCAIAPLLIPQAIAVYGKLFGPYPQIPMF